MIRTTRIALVCALVESIVGCAGYTARPVANAAEDAAADGIRYYEMAPYLLIYADGKGGITSSIEMMPDTSRRMVMDLHAFAAKNNTTLTFVNGVLTTSKFIVDNTVVPASIVGTIKTLGLAAMNNAAMNDPGSGTVRQVPAPYLFKIVIDKDGTRLVGGQGVDGDNNPVTIQVTVTSEAASATSLGGQL